MDTVYVWFAASDPARPVDDALWAVLDESERARAAALRHERERRRFGFAHGVMRTVIGAHIGADPAGLTFTTGRHGKPDLAGDHAGTHVSLSHSGDLCAVAVCATRPVGIDIQQILPGLNAASMAERYFPPSEAALVTGEPDEGARAGRFARIWARKEAVVKARGGRLIPGLLVPVTEPGRPAASGSLDGGSGGILVGGPFTDADDVPASVYRVGDVAAPDGFRAAVAATGEDRVHVVHRWWAGAPGHGGAVYPTVSSSPG